MNPEINNSGVSKKSNKGTITLIVIIILIIIASVYAFTYYKKVKTLSQDPAKVNEAKIAELVKKVGRLIDLPTDESPVLATITDTAPLANNPFFVNAKIGDEVLLYTVSKKAFLYDPKADLIIEVASLNIGK